ncbi:MAG: polysaccharide deacetylase family protein [Clostridia bacterium]|nr:polysaccharide deacetylase family protein [Clostridia bacterium]
MSQKLVSLTFDDGPNTAITPQVLDILEENGIVASFFLIAASITEESEKVARRAFEMGCEINNHSVTHPFMGKMTQEEIRREIDPCTEAVKRITGRAPRFFRPPFIDVSRTLFDTVDMTFICGVGCEDWVPTVSAEERARRILENPQDGDLFLLHDMPGNVNTVEALKVVIPELKARGFGFATCGQLFDAKGVTPVRGRLYSNVLQTEDCNGL